MDAASGRFAHIAQVHGVVERHEPEHFEQRCVAKGGVMAAAGEVCVGEGAGELGGFAALGAEGLHQLVEREVREVIRVIAVERLDVDIRGCARCAGGDGAKHEEQAALGKDQVFERVADGPGGAVGIDRSVPAFCGESSKEGGGALTF
jgi:hypothetical protein